MSHFQTSFARNASLSILTGALILFGCTINTYNSAPKEQPATSGGEEKKPEPEKEKPKPEKKPDKPKEEKPAAKPEKPKEEKPKADKPKEEKPAAKPDKPKPKPKPEPKPEAKPEPKPAPLPERSKIVLPVKISLESLEKQIEEIVPKDDKKDWTKITKGEESPKADLKYELWRDPIDIKLEGSTFRITVPVRYAATIRAQMKNPLTKDWFWIAKGETWGTREEPQRITATFEAKLSVDEELRMKSELKLVKLEHGEAPSGNICKNVGIDVCVPKSSVAGEVRDGINDRLEPKLKKALDKVEEKVEKAFDLRKRAEKVWLAMQAPRELPGAHDDAWLVVRPSALGVSGPTKDGSDVRVDLAIEGKVAVESGVKPKVKAEPLPKLSKVEGETGFFVVAELRLPEDMLGKQLEQQLKGASFTNKKKEKLAITRVQVVAGSDEKHPKRLLVKVAFGDEPEDELQIQGELKYDHKTQRLSLVDFAFTASSKGVLASKLAGYDHNTIREHVQAKAQWDLSNEAGSLKKAISAALAQNLRGDANVVGSLDQIEVRDFGYGKATIEAKVIVGGKLEIVINAK